MVAAADPTLESLRMFDDVSQWVIKENVPVFDAHYEIGDNGQVVNFDAEELQVYCDNMNRRETESGDLCPLTDGHTLGEPFKTPEKFQPEILGYARHFSVGRFGPSKKLAILCTFYIKKAKVARASELPRRSVERWVKSKIFDPIALLARTPERDLGLVTYAKRRSERIARYAKEYGDMAEEKVEDKTDGTPQAEPDMADVAPAEPTTSEELTGDEENMAKKYIKMYAANPAHHNLMKYMHHLHGDAAMKYAAGGGMPSASDTFVPGTQSTGMQPSGPVSKNAKTPETPIVETKPADNRHSEDVVRYAALEAQVAELKKQQEEAIRYSRHEKRRADLRLLEPYFDFQLSEEFEDVKDLPEDRYARHLERVRKNYARKPTSTGFIPTYTGNVEGPEPSNGASKEQMEKAVRAVDRARANGNQMDFDAALAGVTGKAS